MASQYTVLTLGLAAGSDPSDLLLLGFGVGEQPPPVADFTATPLTGTAPLTVQFTDESTGDPDTWLWDFGDGDTSTEQNPSHVYLTAGTYSPSLTVTNDAGSDEFTRTDYIIVSEPSPVPSGLVCGTALVFASVVGSAVSFPSVAGTALLPEC